jgi:CheY-like chemotaxis protein
VLLVDDDRDFLQALAALITEPGIAIVGTATSGEEALERLEELQPDLVVVDVLMPGMGGVEAARLCRERLPSCRIIVISGSIFAQNSPDPIELAADGFMTKSDVLRRLAPTIINLCRPTETH